MVLGLVRYNLLELQHRSPSLPGSTVQHSATYSRRLKIGL